MSAPAPFREPGLSASVAKLLRLRVAILVNGIRRAKRRKKIAYAIAGIGLLGFLGFLLSMSIALLAFLRSPLLARYIGDTRPVLECFPSMVLSVSSIGILLTSFSVLLQTLYLSGDMDFLMSTPLPIRAVFVAKMVQAVLPNFIILCILALPALFGLGISGGYHFSYYPCVVIMMAAMTLAAASLASLLVLAVARLFPPRRVAEVLGFVVGLSVFISSQTAQYIDYDFAGTGGQRIDTFTRMIGRFNNPLSPLAWAGRGLVGLGKGEYFSASGLLGAALILTGIIFCVALATSQRLYYTGWASLQNNRRKSKNKTRPATAAPALRVHPLARLVPAPVRAILAKDLRLCRRDLNNLSGLLTPLILGVIYAFGLVHSRGRMPVGRGKAPPAFIHAGNSMLAYGDIALALFLGWMLVSNLAGLAFTREGKNYWMLKAAPVDTRQMLAAKFLVSYIPSALVCSVYVLALEVLKRVNPWSIAASLITVCMMVAGLTGIYLALGTRGAKFDWENPAQRYRSIGCVGMLIGMLFLPVCFLTFIVPAVLAEVLQFPAAAGRMAGLLLGGITCALAVIIPLSLVEKRVATLAEDCQ